MNLSLNAARRIVCIVAALAGCCFYSAYAASAPATQPTTAAALISTQPTTSQADAFSGDAPLPHDPADVRGQFPNGLHYVIRKNANPPGKVFLDLAVRTGSLNETDEQNGLAHFLEHMAFKGSTHYAPTRLIPMLQHLGMRFGADTNAHTNQYETVFKLTMPDTKPETLNTALTIFSDYASGLSLFPIQIESERRVILEEMRSRVNVASRERKEEFNQLFPGSRMAVHDVLGDPEILKSAQQPLFVDYWNRWYRPEKMTLVVVGDIDPNTIIAQAGPLLGTFTARATAQPAMDAGLKPFEADRAVVISDPEQITGDVEMLSLQPVRPVITTYAQWRQRTIDGIAIGIVNRRIQAFINSGKAPFQSARLSAGDMLHDAFMTTARAQGEPEDWKKTLALLVYEISRVVDNGFTQHEWENARDGMLAATEQAVNTESTRDSSDLVSAIATDVDIDQPMLSSTQSLDLLKQVLATVTIDDLKNAFVADFKSGNYAYVLKLPAPAAGRKLPTEEQVLSVANAAWELPTRPTTQSVAAVPLLPAEPAPGQVASRNVDADLGITNVVFENGVVLHHRFSDYKKDQVLVQIVLPGGMLEETADNHGISSVASLILDRPATSHLTSTQIHTALGNKNVSVNGRIGLDSMSINVTGTPADLPTGLQLVHAILTDGKLEQPAVDRWKKLGLQSLRGKPMLADPQLSDALSATLMGGDPRFAPTTPESIQLQQRSLAQAWFKRIADHAAVEVTVVGDMPADQAVSLVATYLGSLPKRTGTFVDLDPLRKLTRAPSTTPASNPRPW
jgi:zinc protease